MERKVWRLVGGLVLVAALLVGGTSAWGRLAQQSSTEQKVFWQSIKTVKVDSGGASVRLRAGAPDRVTVQETMEWAVRRPSVDLTVTGDTLKVAVKCHTPFGPLGCGVSLDIDVPAATTVRAQSTSGSTQIRGVSGEIWVRTTSGEIQLDGVSGPVWAQSTSGQVVARELGSAEVQAGASSGRVALSFARAPRAVTAAVTSGRVVIVVPTRLARYRVEGSTASGTREIDPGVVDSTSTRVIDVSTASGQVTVSADPTSSGSDPAPAPSSSGTPPSLPGTALSSSPPTAPSSPPTAPPPASAQSRTATAPGGGQ